MASWFVDASVFLASEDAEDGNHEDAVRLLRAKGAIATLDLAYYEVPNVAVRAWRDEQQRTACARGWGPWPATGAW